MNINIHAAKTNLSRLIEKVSQGETIIISKAGKPVAKLVPYDEKQQKRKPGFMKGEIWIADDFDAPLPEDILADFEGRNEANY
jgi:prevent-host-death family protein